MQVVRLLVGFETSDVESLVCEVCSVFTEAWLNTLELEKCCMKHYFTYKLGHNALTAVIPALVFYMCIHYCVWFGNMLPEVSDFRFVLVEVVYQP